MNKLKAKNIEKKLDFLAKAKESMPEIEENQDDLFGPAPEEVGPCEAGPEEAKVTEPDPLGGGEMVGAIINPTPAKYGKLPGYDQHGFSNSRSFGACMYEPLVKLCGSMLDSPEPIIRILAHRHLYDRFLVEREMDAEKPFTDAEKNLIKAGRIIGGDLLKRGAFGPLVFPPIEAYSIDGARQVPGHYIASMGYAYSFMVLPEFKDFMSKHALDWIMQDYREVEDLVEKIDDGLAAPVLGYDK
jgi:hypothetical protein